VTDVKRQKDLNPVGNPARPKHVAFGTEGANKRWGKKNPLSMRRHDLESAYSVTVGNIGMVWDGDDLEEATETYNEYVEQSQSGTGRAGDEEVTLWRHEDGEPIEEYFPGGHDLDEDYENPARPKHVAFGTEGANKRWGKSKATASKKKSKKNPDRSDVRSGACPSCQANVVVPIGQSSGSCSGCGESLIVG